MYPSRSSVTPLYAEAPVFVPQSVSGQTVQQFQPSPIPPPSIPQVATFYTPANVPTSQDAPRYYTQPSQPVALARVCVSPPLSKGSQPLLNSVTYAAPWLPQVRHDARPPLQMQVEPQSPRQPLRRVPQPRPSSQATYYPQKTSPNATYTGGTTLVEVSETSQVNIRRTVGFGGNSSIRQEQTIYLQNTSYPCSPDEGILPLTEPERQKLLSQFFEVLSLHGAMDVCDNRLLSVFMQLPAPIRRSIKRLGGLKQFLEQAEEFFLVDGDTVSLHQAVEESFSYDPTELEESRTEDISMADIIKGPTQLDCSHGSGSPDEEELESAKLFEICSFLTSGYGNGDGYYADYLALYPGKKPPYGGKPQDKGLLKDSDDKMPAQAKAEKDKPLHDASGSSPSAATALPEKLVSADPRMSTGEKFSTKEAEDHTGTLDDSYELQRVCAALRNQAAFASVPLEDELRGAGTESSEQAEDVSGVREASAPEEHQGRSGTDQSEQGVYKTTPVWKPQEKLFPRRKMASIFSGHTTMEGQNKWLHHLQTLAASHPPDQSLSTAPHDEPDAACSTTDPPVNEVSVAQATLCEPPSSEESILEEPSSNFGMAEGGDAVPCSPGDASTGEDKKCKLQHAEDPLKKSSAGCPDEHHPEVETEVCQTPSEESEPISIPEKSGPSLMTDGICSDTSTADLQVNPNICNTCESKEAVISSGLPCDTLGRSSEFAAESANELDGEYEVDGSFSSECCLEVAEKNLDGFGSEEGNTAEVIPDPSMTGVDLEERPDESTHSEDVTTQGKVLEESSPLCPGSSDESDMNVESSSLQTEESDPSTTVALKEEEAYSDDILPEDKKKHIAEAPALEVAQEDGVESKDSQQEDLGEDQKTTTEPKQASTLESSSGLEQVFNSQSTSRPNHVVQEADANDASEDQSEADLPGSGNEGMLIPSASPEYKPPIFRHRMVLVEDDDDDDDEFSEEETCQFLEASQEDDEEVDPLDLSKSSSKCLTTSSPVSNPKDAEEEQTSGDHSESIPSVQDVEETLPSSFPLGFEPPNTGGHRIVLVQDDEQFLEEWNPEFAEPKHQPQDDEDQLREVSSESSLECIPVTVQEPDLKDTDQSGATSKTQDSAPVKVKNKGVNTNEIRMCSRAVSTKKIVQKNLGTSTEIVTQENRGVDTPKELEEAYMKKYHEAVKKVSVLEITLECERDLMTTQRSKHALEIREARDSLQKTKEVLWDVERELDLRRRQQTTELKKATVELRELQGKLSLRESKLLAAEKLNSCLSRELETVTRELLDLESSSVIANAIDKVVPRADAATDTQELDRVCEDVDSATAKRMAALVQRAKDAEVKVLEIKYQAIKQKIISTLNDAEYAYNMYASNSQLSLPEKVNLVTRWTEYQNNAQASISKLENKYGSLVRMIQSEDKVLEQLPELKGATMDPFTVPAPKHQSLDQLSTTMTAPASIQPQQLPFQFTAQPVPTLPLAPVPGPVSTHMEGSGDRKGLGPLAGSCAGATRQGRLVRVNGRGRGRRPSGSLSCPIRPGRDDQLQEAMKPAVVTGQGLKLSPSQPTQVTTSETEGSQYLSQPPSAPEPVDHRRIPCGPEDTIPAGFSKSDIRTPPPDGGDAPVADGLKESAVKSRAERIRNFQQRRCLSKLSKFKSAVLDGPHPTAGAGSLPSGGHSARKLNLLGGSSFIHEHASSQPVGLPSEGMPGSAPLPHHSTTAGATDPPQQSHCPTSDSSRMSPTSNLSDLCPETWLQEIADAAESATTLPVDQKQLPEVSSMLFHQPFIHQHLPSTENQMHLQSRQQANQLPLRPPPQSLQSSLPSLMSLNLNPSADLQQRAVSPGGSQSARWIPPREHAEHPGQSGLTPPMELQSEQLRGQMASTAEKPSMNFHHQAGLQESSTSLSNMPVDVQACQHTDPSTRNETLGDTDAHQMGLRQDSLKQGCQAFISPEIGFNTEGVVNPYDIQSAESLTPAQRISMEWKAQNVAGQQASRPGEAVDAAYEAEKLHSVPSESPSPNPASSSPSLETSKPPEPLPDTSGDHDSGDPKMVEARPSGEMPLPNQLPHHHSGVLPAQLKSHDADSQGVKLIPPKLAPAPSKSHTSQLPPRFQTSHRVQQQRSKFTFAGAQDPIVVGPKSTKEDGVLKKRKVMALDKLEEIKVTSGTGQEGDEWQTQMSKRKKRALAHQEAQLQALKAKKLSSMDKLIAALTEQFPDTKTKDVLDAVQRVRMDHNGSLSGIAFNTIIAESMLYLRDTKRELIPAQLKAPKTQPRKRELPTLQALKEVVPKQVSQEEHDMCVICQELMDTKSGDIRMLDCGHLFHDECISIWYNSRERTCPTCRCHTLFAEDFPRLQ